MNKKQTTLLQLVLLSSPLIVGYLYGLTQPSDSVYGIIVMTALFIGWPLILIIGGVVSRLTKNSKHAIKYSLAAYIIPTFFVLLWELGSLVQ